MSVGKIALGVFLGNLMFGVLAWVVVGTSMSRKQARVDRASAEAQVHALEAQPGTGGSDPIH